MRFRIKQYVNTTTGIAILAAIGLVACNNGSNTSASTNPGGGGGTAPMTLSYNIDGHNINGGASLSVFQDSGWHLLTLTANESYTATAIQGVAYRFKLGGTSWGGINAPAGSAGLSVVTDPTLNTCETAIFQNQGDSCSVRFRIAYDTALSSTIPSNTSMYLFPGNYTSPNINLGSVPVFSVAPNPTQAVADVRVIQPVESSYWQSTAISESPNLYQIIQVQNGSPQESLNISTISGLTNPNYFSLVNRSTPAGQNDPVYGSYAQCATSTTANPANNRVSNLPALNNNCILVYQVTQQISQQAVESDIVNIYFPNQQTNIFPSGNNTQQLIANFGELMPPITINGADMAVQAGDAESSGTNIKMTAKGTLNSGQKFFSNRFGQLTVTNYIIPANAVPITTYEAGAVIHTPYGQTIPASGSQLLIFSSNGELQHNSVTSSGGISSTLYSSNNITVTSSQVLALQGVVYVQVVNAPQFNTSSFQYDGVINWSGNVSINHSYGTYDLYGWNNGGMPAYLGYACELNAQAFNTYNTTYSVLGLRNTSLDVYPKNGCNNGTYDITITVPITGATDNVINLATALPASISYIGSGGQTVVAQIGNNYGSYPISYSVINESSGELSMSGVYQNGSYAGDLSFAINLNAGDTLLYSTVAFTGNLLNFNMSNVN